MKLPKRITNRWLRERSACRSARKLFRSIWPGGCEVTYKNLLRAARADLPIVWLATRLLDREQLNTYFERERLAFTVYNQRINNGPSDGWHQLSTRQRTAKVNGIYLSYRLRLARILGELLGLTKPARKGVQPMKAKDWIAKFNGDHDSETWTSLLKDYILETHELAKKRGYRDQAIEGAVREQFQKWQAICQGVPYLDNAVLADGLEAWAPELWKVYCTIGYRNYARRQFRFINAQCRQQLDAAALEKDPAVRLGLTLAAILDAHDQRQEIFETMKGGA